MLWAWAVGLPNSFDGESVFFGALLGLGALLCQSSLRSRKESMS